MSKMNEMKELLRELCLTFGPSGLEDNVRQIIARELEKYKCDGVEIFSDNLGGIYFHIKNEGAPRLMINAHMDEVGFMITDITDSGALKFGCVGGMNPLTLNAKRVVSENGIKGVITSKPIHLLTKEERKAFPKIKDMRIDIGATSRENALEYVSIGDYFVFDSEFIELGGTSVKAKAIDDRGGCAAMLQTIRELSETKKSPCYDLYFAFTVREEVGYSGAGCACELIKPDYAIIVESKAVLDYPDIGEASRVAVSGEGGVISYADRGTIMDRALTESLVGVCKKNNIKYQINREIAGGNDASTIQKAVSGAKVALISMPSKYIHSSANVIDFCDLECICSALTAFVTKEN